MEQNEAQTLTPVVEPPTRKQIQRAVVGASMGTFIEWFEYGSYAYFATVIAANFFPSSSPSVGLIQAFAVFAVSFAMRPIGGLFWAHFGDKIGRQRTLAISIMGMGVATAGIGLLPNHAHIGLLAPVLLLVFRLLQSFCAAGEYVGAAILVGEYAPASHRARWCATVPICLAAGFLAASLFSTALNGLLSEEAVNSWGWRIPFFVAVPLTVVAWYIRKRIDESPAFRELQKSGAVKSNPLREALRSHWRTMLRMVFVTAVNAVGYYLVLTYMASYMEQNAGFSKFQASLVLTAALFTYLPMVYGAACLADRYGRRTILLANCVLFIVLSYPAFVLLGNVGVVGALLIQIGLTAVFSLNDGAFSPYFVEAFPAAVRFTGFAVPFNIGVALFGGTGPLVATWLIDVTDDPRAPAYILMIIAAIGAVALLIKRDPYTPPKRDSRSTEHAEATVR